MKRLAVSLAILLLAVAWAPANDGVVLRYDSPATNDLVDRKPEKKKEHAYMRTALPLGNGRLGAMFSGGIDVEHLLINDITLWMNAKRGTSEVAQSGTRTGGKAKLETVRKAYREGKYGTKRGSMESLATEHLSSQQPLGNYAPFAEVIVTTEHDPASASDYRRTLDSRTGVGTVRYSIDDATFTREYFCSYPHDVAAVRFFGHRCKTELDREMLNAAQRGSDQRPRQSDRLAWQSGNGSGRHRVYEDNSDRCGRWRPWKHSRMAR